MAYRLLLSFFVLSLGACDLDLGDEKGTRERTAPDGLTVVSDGGTTFFVNEQGCTFVPCESAYGTNCGFVCPAQ